MSRPWYVVRGGGHFRRTIIEILKADNVVCAWQLSFFLGTYSEVLKLSVSQMVSLIEFVIAEIFSCGLLV